MRRARLLVAPAVLASAFAFASLDGCSSFDGAPSDVGPGDGAAIEAPAPILDGGNIDSASEAAAPRTLKPIYARGYGSAGDAGRPVTIVPTGLTVDPSGGVFVAGSYAGGAVTIDTGALPMPENGVGDAFLVQLDGMGGQLQSRVFGDGALQTGGEVVGSAANLYASFLFSGSISFPDVQNGVVPNGLTSSGTAGNPNSIVARFHPQPRFGGQYAFTGTDATRITHLALGSSQSAIAFGDWVNGIKTGSAATTVTRSTTRSGLVIARMLSDSVANIVRTDLCDDQTSCTGSALATNGVGEPLVGGRFAGTIGGFDGGAPVTATGGEDAYLIKLDAQLSPQWVISFGGTGVQEVTAIAVVPKTSDFIVAGVFHESFTPAGQTVSIPATDAGSDVFVMRVGATGNVVWTKTFGGDGDDIVRGVAVDPDANIFLVGDFHGPGLSFGGSVLINADDQGMGTRDIFVAWLDGAGNHVYSGAFGSPGDESPVAVGLDGAGNIIVTGSFDHAIDFGAGLVRASGATDMFVARLSR